MIVNLHLTHKCNLRCTYCYTGDKTLHDMEPETLLESFRFMENHLQEEDFTLVFFGGEPLVRFDLLQKAVHLAEQLPKKYAFQVATNGTLFSQEILDFCREHRVRVSLSLDGKGSAQDAGRPFLGGRGSWRAVEPWIDPLLEAMPHTAVFMVVHPSNLKHLAGSVEYFIDRGFRFINTALDYSAAWTPELFEDLARSYLDLGRVYGDRLKRGDRFHLSLYDSRIRSRVWGPCAVSERCAAGLHQVSIAPSGWLYPCVQFVREDRDEHLRIGHVSTGILPEKRTEHAATEGYPDDVCASCFLKDRCSHWCRCVSLQTMGSPDQVSPVFCAHEKMATRIVDAVAEKLFSRRYPGFIHKHYNREYPFLAALEDLIDEAFPDQGDGPDVRA